ncbi:adenylyl-sulfate kinase [Deltaproteobacteria bacterium Smac51]|nr:adenylyl-sulfate kinase [Deltaproteobacteria bacterium Smac51]
MLIIFSGLPGTGKSTIARSLALNIRATLLRIDSLEHALVESGLVKKADEIGPSGYMAAYALAADNLKLGLTVISDSVNPYPVTRDAWRDVAVKSEAPYLEIEVICSDLSEHKRRVESRQSDIPGFIPPTWDEVVNRDYMAWSRERLILDSAGLSVEQAVSRIMVAKMSL